MKSRLILLKVLMNKNIKSRQWQDNARKSLITFGILKQKARTAVYYDCRRKHDIEFTATRHFAMIFLIVIAIHIDLNLGLGLSFVILTCEVLGLMKGLDYAVIQRTKTTHLKLS